jgi:hypothetical protein
MNSTLKARFHAMRTDDPLYYSFMNIWSRVNVDHAIGEGLARTESRAQLVPYTINSILKYQTIASKLRLVRVTGITDGGFTGVDLQTGDSVWGYETDVIAVFGLLQVEIKQGADGGYKAFIRVGDTDYGIGYGSDADEARAVGLAKLARRIDAPYRVGDNVFGKFAGQGFAGKITYVHEIPCFELPSNWYLKITLDKPITVSMKGELETIETEVYGDGLGTGVIKAQVYTFREFIGK